MMLGNFVYFQIDEVTDKTKGLEARAAHSGARAHGGAHGHGCAHARARAH